MLTQLRRWSKVKAGAVTLALILTGCSGGDEQAGSTEVAMDTGTVSVLVTDAPTDALSEINLSIRRIELLHDGGSFALYNGRTRINLLRLERLARLFSRRHDVPVREYRGFRLTFDDVEFVDHNRSAFFPPIGNGVLELAPARPFRVGRERAHYVKFDIHARRSARRNADGGGWQWRPVTTVETGDEENIDQLVEIRAVVRNIDLAVGGFDICKVDESEGVFTVTDECLTAGLHDDTSIFNPDGGQGSIADLVAEEIVKVIGEFDPDDSSIFNVEVVERDALAAYLTVYGTASANPDVDSAFPLAMDAGQNATGDPVINVQLQAGTRVFDANGSALDASNIAPDDVIEATGVLATSTTEPDTLWAQMIIVSPPPEVELSNLRGYILSEVDGTGTFTLFRPNDGNRCVRVLENAEINLVVTSLSTGNTENVTGSLADLALGREVDAYGSEGEGGCFDAQQMVVMVTSD